MKPYGIAIAISLLLAASARAQELDRGWWTTDSAIERKEAWKGATVEMVTADLVQARTCGCGMVSAVRTP